jgi:hypothetical protein
MDDSHKPPQAHPSEVFTNHAAPIPQPLLWDPFHVTQPLLVLPTFADLSASGERFEEQGLSGHQGLGDPVTAHGVVFPDFNTLPYPNVLASHMCPPHGHQGIDSGHLISNPSGIFNTMLDLLEPYEDLETRATSHALTEAPFDLLEPIDDVDTHVSRHTMTNTPSHDAATGIQSQLLPKPWVKPRAPVCHAKERPLPRVAQVSAHVAARDAEGRGGMPTYGGGCSLYLSRVMTQLT